MYETGPASVGETGVVSCVTLLSCVTPVSALSGELIRAGAAWNAGRWVFARPVPPDTLWMMAKE